MDRRIRDITRRQYALIATWQLRRLGIDKDRVEHLVACNILQFVMEGVYVLGGFDRTNLNQCVMAAVLSAGPGAAASHTTALWLLGYSKRFPDTIHVTSPRQLRPRPGMHVHHAPTLTRADQTLRHGISCTNQSWTLLDAGCMLSVEQLANVLHEADYVDQFDIPSLGRAIERRPRKHGVRNVRRALEMHESGQAGTGSPLEDDWLAVFRARDRSDPHLRGLYEPEVNPRITVRGWNMRPDFLFRAHRVIVEVDGGRVHDRPRTTRDDKDKELALAAEHFVVIRVRWSDIHRRPLHMLRQLARAIANQPRYGELN